MKKSKRNVIIAILILIVLLLLFFLIIHFFGEIDNKIPTGNVDIFDLVFNISCTDKCPNCDCNKNKEECTCKHRHQPTTNKHNNNLDSNNTTEGNITINPDNSQNASGLEVYDEDQNYTINTKLNIFKHKSYYVVNDLIAPGTENSYQFIVRNNNNFDIKYNIKMSEENKYNINMKYRLKLGGKYVVGDNKQWVTYDQLKKYNSQLPAGTYDVYTLDWKWFEGENDTQIGTQIDANYELNLEIGATQN